MRWWKKGFSVPGSPCIAGQGTGAALGAAGINAKCFCRAPHPCGTSQSQDKWQRLSTLQRCHHQLFQGVCVYVPISSQSESRAGGLSAQQQCLACALSLQCRSMEGSMQESQLQSKVLATAARALPTTNLWCNLWQVCMPQFGQTAHNAGPSSTDNAECFGSSGQGGFL